MTIDPRKYYDLEGFLFQEVQPRFVRDGEIGAVDFFSIVIWKANRAKSRIAKRLMSSTNDGRDLEEIARELTRQIARTTDAKERLRYLMEKWEFRLPMASAILTVLYPEEFTVYDVRACDSLDGFRGLDLLTNFDRLWEQFEKFVEGVRATDPSRSLRDNDRRLWGQSALAQLNCDIKKGFRAAPARG